MTIKLAPQNQTPAKPGNPQQPAVIAVRKRCDADGVGLSHYILVDRKTGK